MTCVGVQKYFGISMRSLGLLLASALLTVGCNDGDAAPLGIPEMLRSCGELDGVGPVEPVVLGQDAEGCPIFEPVPCTQPRAYYEALCGEGCGAGVARNADGDEWVPGCWANCAPVAGIDGDEGPFFACHDDPVSGETLWSIVAPCASLYDRMRCTWEPCEQVPTPLGRPESCQ